MINKLKKYHKDFEIAQNELEMKISDDTKYFGYYICTKNTTTEYSDVNGLYDMSSDSVSAFCVDFTNSFIWPPYICDY